MMEKSISVFVSYARQDDPLRKELDKHLSLLKRQGWINVWYDRDISVGTEWEREIDKHLNTAQIILLLISPDFMASEYCYSIEMKRAMERHDQGEAHVIPIILRPVFWQAASFGKLQVLPTEGKPVTDRTWHTLDDAFFNVAEGIRQVIEKFAPAPQTGNSDATDNSSTLPSSRPSQIIVPSTFAGASIRSQPPGDETGGGTNPVTGKKPPTRRGRISATPITGFLLLAVILITLTSGGFFWSAHLQKQKTAPGNTPEVLRSPPSFPSPASSSTPASHFPLVYRGHSQAVKTLAWSPNGAYLASGGDDHSVQVWNAFTGQRITLYQGHTDIVNSLVWSPGGTLIASASADHSVQVWNALTGHFQYRYDGYGNNVVALDWSPDGKYLALGGDVNTIQILDSATGALQQTYVGHTDSIWCLKWSPDGHYLASGSRDHTVRVWNSQGQIRTLYNGQHGDIYLNDLVWSTDGKAILSGSVDGTIAIWNAFTGATINQQPLGVHNINGLSLHNTLLASGSDDGSVTIRNLTTLAVIYVYQNHHTKPITMVTFSPNGGLIASGSEDTTVQVWKPA